MSSAALVPSLHERPEATPRRRGFLSVCPSVLAAPAPGATPAPGEALAAEAVGSVPAAPSVAVLRGGRAAEPEPANVNGPRSGARPSAARLRSELIEMLPSLERRAYRWCRDRAEAQDLAQDTVLRALGNPRSFDSEGHLRAWLYTVLRNLFISRRRRQQSWQRASGELCGLARSTAPPGPAFLTPSLERAIARLPEGFAHVVRLVDLEDYSYADAASALGVPVGTVMSRLFRARQRLAQDLPALV